MKSKSTTVILSLLLGGIGVHRFYLGETWTGLFYLLFSWTFIPLFLSIIDFLCFLFMSDQTFNRKYNFTNIKIGYYTEYELDNNYEGESKNISSEIEKLHLLKEKGILSETEFQQAKNKIL